MKNRSSLFQLTAVSGMGMELALSVGLFTWFGYKADAHWGLDPWLTLAGFSLGLVLAVITVKKTLERLEEMNK